MADLLSQFPDDGAAPEPVAVGTHSPGRALPALVGEPAMPSDSGAIAPAAMVPETMRALNATQRYRAENAREGVPLSTTNPGKDLGYFFYPELRAVLARSGSEKDQQAVLEHHYGAQNVRKDKKSEDFIITVPDAETGKPRDVKLRDTEQMTVGDMAAIATSAVGVAGAIAGTMTGRSLPLGLGKVKGAIGYLRDLVAGSAGMETADAVVRGGIRATLGQNVNPGEIAADAANNMIPDMAVGLGTTAVAKTIRGVGNFMQAPFSFSRKPIHEVGIQAIKDLEKESGIKLLYDPGEATGFPLFAMGRQYIRAHPAAAALQMEFDSLQNSRISAFKDFLFGGAGSDEEAGRAVVNRLQAIRDAAENTVGAAQKQVGEKAQGAINSMLPGTAELRPTVTGEKARQAVLSKGESITKKKNTLFEKVNELPEASESIFPTKGVSATMFDIKARLPDREKIVESASPILDEFGQSIPTTVESRELIREFVPPDVAKFVDTKFDEKMPLRKMIEMRNLLWDRYIPEGEANPGISTRYLGEVSHAITESIDQTVSGLPNGELKKRLGAANTYYKDQYLKLKESGIQDLFHKPTEGVKYVNPENVIARIQSSPSTYRRTLDLLGPSSPEANEIRRSVFDDLLLRSRDAIDNTQIDGKKLLANMESMQADKSTREIFANAIGVKSGALAKAAKVLGAAQGSLPMDEVRAALTSGTTSLSGTPAEIAELNKIVTAQQNRDTLLNNQLVKAATKGTLDLDTVNPEKMVNSLFNTGTKSDVDTLAAWAHTDPAFEKQLQRKTIEKFFADAQTAQQFEGKLLDAAGKPTEYGEKFKLLVGPKNFKLIQDYISYEKPRDYASELAGGAGMFAKASIVGKFVRSFPFFGEAAANLGKEAKDIIGAKMIGATLVNPTFRESLLRASTAKDFKDLALAVSASTPFIESLSENMSDADVLGVMSTVRSVLHSSRVSMRPDTAAPTQTGNANFLDQFK